MKGTIVLYSGKLAPRLCREHPEKLFVFGDNLKRVGMAGQACIRYEGNSFGVPTKAAPSMAKHAFFNDSNRQFFVALDSALDDLWDNLDHGVVVVIPSDENGLTTLGTGLSRLPIVAPQLAEMLQNDIDQMCAWFPKIGPVDRIT